MGTLMVPILFNHKVQRQNVSFWNFRFIFFYLSEPTRKIIIWKHSFHFIWFQFISFESNSVCFPLFPNSLRFMQFTVSNFKHPKRNRWPRFRLFFLDFFFRKNKILFSNWHTKNVKGKWRKREKAEKSECLFNCNGC